MFVSKSYFFSIILLALPLLSVGASADESFQTGYNGGFFMQSQNKEYRLKIGAILKTLGAYQNTAGQSLTTFSFKESRLKLSGNLFGDRLTFVFVHDFGDNRLKDFHIDIQLAKDCAYLLAGQFKGEFSRQTINSSGKLNFTDISNANKGFAIGRVLGVALHQSQKQPIEWSTGIFQEGFFGRLGYTQEGMSSYDETKFEDGGFKAAAAANGYIKTSFKDMEVLGFAGGLDAMFKLPNSTTQVALFVGRPNLKTDITVNPTLTAEKQQIGFHFQSAYQMNHWVIPAIQYSLLTEPGATKITHELTCGINFLLLDKNLKLQFEGGVLIEANALKRGLANLLLQFDI